MSCSTRVIGGDVSYTLYVGDIVEGSDAVHQVAAGNAYVIEEDKPAEPEPAVPEDKPAVVGGREYLASDSAPESYAPSKAPTS